MIDDLLIATSLCRNDTTNEQLTLRFDDRFGLGYTSLFTNSKQEFPEDRTVRFFKVYRS